MKHRKLGLIGGLSWESTTTYYKLLNEGTRQRLGRLHSADLLLWSFDFEEIEALQAEGDWAAATDRMIEAGKALKAAGAEGLIICSNTMHLMADEVAAAAGLPLLHIADATRGALLAAGAKRPLLLATAFTMEKNFYRDRVSSAGEIDVVIPNSEDRAIAHQIIYDELCQGLISHTSRKRYQEIIARNIDAQQIDAVIFGCTEIGLLLDPADIPLPCFDTTHIHCAAALDFQLGRQACLHPPLLRPTLP